VQNGQSTLPTRPDATSAILQQNPNLAMCRRTFGGHAGEELSRSINQGPTVGTDASSGEQGLVTADGVGRVESGGRRLSAIEPLVPVYDTPGGKFALSPGRGHHLLLRFHPNDLGRAAFDREPLLFSKGALVLNRQGTEIRFIRVQH